MYSSRSRPIYPTVSYIFSLMSYMQLKFKMSKSKLIILSSNFLFLESPLLDSQCSAEKLWDIHAASFCLSVLPVHCQVNFSQTHLHVSIALFKLTQYFDYSAWNSCLIGLYSIQSLRHTAEVILKEGDPYNMTPLLKWYYTSMVFHENPYAA